jgi:predicted ATP-grasp superfamily ATP-dependent carboligase
MPALRVFLYEFTVGGGLVACRDAEFRSLAREGRAMHGALARDFAALDGVEVVTLGDSRIAKSVVGAWRTVVVRSPRDEQAEFRRCAARADWSVVIAPETGGRLLERCRWVLDSGGRLLGPGPDFVAWAGDKGRTADELARARIAVPLGVALHGDQPLPEDFPYPAVLKPNDGAGSLATRLVSGPNDVARPLAGFVWRLERYCLGRPASVSLVTGPAGPTLFPPCEQLISCDGLFRYCGGTVPLLPTDLGRRASALAERVARSIEPTLGYLGLDLVLGPDEDGCDDAVIEVNPRLTTSYVGLRAAVRENLARVMLETAVGKPLVVSCRPQAYDFDVAGRVKVRAPCADSVGRCEAVKEAGTVDIQRRIRR